MTSQSVFTVQSCLNIYQSGVHNESYLYCVFDFLGLHPLHLPLGISGTLPLAALVFEMRSCGAKVSLASSFVFSEIHSSNVESSLMSFLDFRRVLLRCGN